MGPEGEVRDMGVKAVEGFGVALGDMRRPVSARPGPSLEPHFACVISCSPDLALLFSGGKPESESGGVSLGAGPDAWPGEQEED